MVCKCSAHSLSISVGIDLSELDMGRVQRNVELGEGTAGSSQQLTQAIDRFEKAILPVEKVVTNLLNTVGGEFMDTMTNIVKAMDRLYEAWKLANPLLAEALKLLAAGSEEGPLEAFGDWGDRVAEEEARKEAEARAAIERMRRAHTGR